MQYRTLPGTGTSVSNLALGTMGFGTETEEVDAFAILDRFVEENGNLVDTANVYGAGASESLLGRWFADRPADLTDRVVLATKARFGTSEDANDAGNSRRNLHRALDASLARLGRETIDLYQLHGWDPLTPIEETLRFLDDAVRAGKINHYGLSNFTGWQLQLAVSTAKALGLHAPVTLQQQYSLTVREVEYECVPAAEYNGLGLLPWSPLSSGFLTGKYQRDVSAPSNSRGNSGSAMFDRILALTFSKQQNWDTLDVVRATAEELEATPAQIALAWLRDRPSVTAPIIGARTISQLEGNLVAGDLRLTHDQVTRLDAVSAPRPGDYPYGSFGAKQRERYVHSGASAIRELE